MRQIILFVIATSALVSIACGQTPQLKMVYTRSKRATFTKEWTYSFPEYTSTRWIFALRYPPELPWSRDVEAVTEIKTSDGWKPFEKKREGSPEAREMFVIDYKHDDPLLKHGCTVRTKFTATIFHQELRKGKGTKPTALSDEEAATLLRATETFNFQDPTVKTWMDNNAMWKTDSESEIDFALRVYRHLRKAIPYNIGDGGPWICSQILKTGFGECCRHAIVGTSILRANGIPARTICAVWAVESNSEGHCWGEFYLKGVGWIPYDTTIDYQNKTTDRYFGSKKGELLGGMVDFDWQIDTGAYGNQTVFGIDNRPAFWVEGTGTIKDPLPTMHSAILPARENSKRMNPSRR